MLRIPQSIQKLSAQYILQYQTDQLTHLRRDSLLIYTNLLTINLFDIMILIRLFLLFYLFSSQIHAMHTFQQEFPTGVTSLLSDTGKLLSRCNGCGQGAYPDSLCAHPSYPSDPWALWKVEMVQGKVAFKADTGKYLSRCKNCQPNGRFNENQIFAWVTDLQKAPWALWTPQRIKNDIWAFKGDNGRYFGRCNGCIVSRENPDYLFCTSESSNYPWVQWRVIVNEKN